MTAPPAQCAPLIRPPLPLLPLLLPLLLLLSGCASGPSARPEDPFEPMNRTFFTVNDKLDTYVASPLAKGYRDVVPAPLRSVVTNFFANLGDVGNFANNLLQGKGKDALDSLMRLALNSTLGIAGLLDIATPNGIDKHPQDFGLTLGTWGFDSGPYLVLPLLGPSTLRDGAGEVVNIEIDPLVYERPPVRNTLYGLNLINTRSNLLGATDLLSQAALDPYTFVRDAYLQQRRYRIASGKGQTSLPTYDETEPAPPAAPVPLPD